MLQRGGVVWGRVSPHVGENQKGTAGRGREKKTSRQPDHVVACLDFKNAFGSIDRTTCIKVLRELCPQHPAWLDAVNVLLSEPVLVVNPECNHLAMTYDGLPQGDPLSTLIFSLSMTEVLHKTIKTTTSEVTTLSYIDDTVLVGPADEIAQILQDLPRALTGTGLSLQPQKNATVGSGRGPDRTAPSPTTHTGSDEGPPGSDHSGRGSGRGPHGPIPHGQ